MEPIWVFLLWISRRRTRSLASVCQVGIADFSGNDTKDDFSTLIDPEDHFAGVNVSIHGIDYEDVAGAPNFPGVYPTIASILSEHIVVSHTAFDRVALNRAIVRYGLPEVKCRWLELARVVRRTWPDCAKAGYGLPSITEKLGIHYRHHNALEDARAGRRSSSACDHRKRDWGRRLADRLGQFAQRPNQHRPRGIRLECSMASMLYLPVHSKSLVTRRQLWPHKSGLPPRIAFRRIHHCLSSETKTSADSRPGRTKSVKRQKAEAVDKIGQSITHYWRVRLFDALQEREGAHQGLGPKNRRARPVCLRPL